MVGRYPRAILVALAAVAAVHGAARAQVVINEVIVDPLQDWNDTIGAVPFDEVPGTGTVSGSDEYIELLNVSGGMVDMNGWTLSMNDTTPVVYTLGSGSAEVERFSAGSLAAFAPGAFAVIGNPSGDMQLTVTLELRDADSNLIDSVVIGAAGAPGFGRDGNASNAAGEAIARVINGVDTGNDATDFHPRLATPGFANPAITPAAAGAVLINELVTDPQQDWNDDGGGVPFDPVPGPGTVTGSDEWFELRNASGSTIDLSGWVLEMVDGSPTAELIGLDGAVLLSGDAGCTAASFTPGCHLVIGDPTGDVTNVSLIRLHDPTGVLVDTVEVGDDPEGDGAGDGAPRGQSGGAAATSINNEAVARIPDGADAGGDATDFRAYLGTPGAANPINSGPPPALVINEIVTDPRSDWNDATPFDGTPGTGALSDTDEYVEIHNRGAQPVNLLGFVVALSDGSPAEYEIGSSNGTTVEVYSEGSQLTALLPGGYVVIGNPPGAASATCTVSLEDLFGNELDTVAIGAGAPAPGHDGSFPGSAGESISRSPDGVDSDDDDADFTARAGTPGASNPGAVAAGAGAVLINEIVIDPRKDWSDTAGGNGIPWDGVPGDGSSGPADQWIELVNTTGNVIDVSSFELVMADAATDTVVIGVDDAEVAASEEGCAASSFSPTCRLVIGNPGGEIDRVALLSLFDATHELVDRVEIGDDLPGDGNGDGAAGVAMADATSDDDEALGRLPDATDTDSDAADFAAIPPTPGAENLPPPDPGSDAGGGDPNGDGGPDAGAAADDDGSGGCGCQGSGAPPGGPGLLLVALALTLCRRAMR